MEFIKKNIGIIIVVFIIAGIATCNIVVNGQTMQKLVDQPAPGHYYVFEDYPAKGEFILKVKDVSADQIEFFVPEQSLIFGFEQNSSEGAIRDADNKGTMYGEQTVSIEKTMIKELLENNTLSGAVNGKAKILHVFQ